MSEAARTAIDLTVVENLYRNHRYLDAFDIEGFRATATRYAPLFGGTLARHEYFSKKRKYLLTVIPEMAGFLETNQTGKFKWVRLKMRIEEFIVNYRRD